MSAVFERSVQYGVIRLFILSRKNLVAMTPKPDSDPIGGQTDLKEITPKLYELQLELDRMDLDNSEDIDEERLKAIIHETEILQKKLLHMQL